MPSSATTRTRSATRIRITKTRTSRTRPSASLSSWNDDWVRPNNSTFDKSDNKNKLPRFVEKANRNSIRWGSAVFDDGSDVPDKNPTNNNNFYPPPTTISSSRKKGDASSLPSMAYQVDDDVRYTRQASNEFLAVESFLRWTPMVIPVLAYAMYDPTAVLFASTLDLLAQNKWVAVDGGAYQAQIIAPAINGVVMPAISILFANLIGNTISTLRQRQLDIRRAINMEAGQLRILQSLLDAFPDQQQVLQARRYLSQYTSRLIAESQPTVHVDAMDSYSLDTELNAVMSEIHRFIVDSHSMKQEQSHGISQEKFRPIPDLILDRAFGACQQLYEERAKRMTALRSLFPPLHFMIVSALAISICIAFLLESNQVLLVFLNAIQLRILWTMLVGTFSALAIVCYDLGNPFRGSYQISKAVDQLYTIRSSIRTSLILSSSQSDQASTTKTINEAGQEQPQQRVALKPIESRSSLLRSPYKTSQHDSQKEQ